MVCRGTSAFPERSVELLLKPLMHALNEDTSLRAPDDVKASRITWLAAKMTVLSAVVPGMIPNFTLAASAFRYCNLLSTNHCTLFTELHVSPVATGPGIQKISCSR